MDATSEYCIKYIRQNPERLKKCLMHLTDDQIWHKPNNSTNSIGNLILHLTGNISQYILSGLGKIKYSRNRELEFSFNESIPKDDLINDFDKIIDRASSIIEAIQIKDLEKVHSIQGFQITGYEVLIHVTEHLSYHMGQIALLTKLYSNTQVGFYEGVDLNK